jgi:phosphoribosyl 1,2-cyclic phosphate phosphodiesterase
LQKIKHLNIYFLGTGTSQGIPVIGCGDPVCLSVDRRDKRLRVSIFIKTEHQSFIIDCGPDFRQQMLISKCQRIDAILFTHEHADHTAGLDDIRPYNFKQGAIPIFAHPRVIENLQKRFDYIFETKNRYPGAPSVIINVVNKNEPFIIGTQTIIPIDAMHGDLQVFGYRIGDFAYMTDVKSIEKSEIEKLKELKVLVINSLKEDSHPTHFNLEEALAFIKEVQPQKAYLTHISHHFGFHEEIQKLVPKNVFVAYDNLEITL